MLPHTNGMTAEEEGKHRLEWVLEDRELLV